MVEKIEVLVSFPTEQVIRSDTGIFRKHRNVGEINLHQKYCRLWLCVDRHG